MKKRLLTLIVLLGVSLNPFFAFGQGTNEEAIIVIHPNKINLIVGDSLQLRVTYKEADMEEIDTTASWLLIPDSLGTISSTNLFIANKIGVGILYATLDTLVDSAEVKIKSEQESDDLPGIRITPEEAEIIVGDSIQFEAVYIDTNETEIDTMVSWSINPDSLGIISEDGLFIASSPGEISVIATLDTLLAWAIVKIELQDDEDDSEFKSRLVLVPNDTTLVIGSQLQYQVFYKDSNDVLVDTIAESWSMEGMPIGDISDDGLLTVEDFGFALINARLSEWEGSAFVMVDDSTRDSTDINTITITRDSPNPLGYIVKDTVSEGELWVISGLPHPVNVLNGGAIYFPIGSLSEDIRIHINLPGFTKVDSQGVSFNHKGVVAGVDFQVIVNDTTSEPYDFEIPLIVGLVYKRGLLKNLGIDPQTLGLYFVITEDDSMIFDTTGISNTTIDFARNRIFSSVSHFSSLAIVGESGSVTKVESVSGKIAKGYRLFHNYPNPFNPVTTIRYAIPEKSHVTMTIYNITGQVVDVLVDQSKNPGYHIIQWDASNVGSGVYFYRIKAGEFTDVKKCLIIK